jgi:hypothetical protein
VTGSGGFGDLPWYALSISSIIVDGCDQSKPGT